MKPRPGEFAQALILSVLLSLDILEILLPLFGPIVFRDIGNEVPGFFVPAVPLLGFVVSHLWLAPLLTVIAIGFVLSRLGSNKEPNSLHRGRILAWTIGLTIFELVVAAIFYFVAVAPNVDTIK